MKELPKSVAGRARPEFTQASRNAEGETGVHVSVCEGGKPVNFFFRLEDAAKFLVMFRGSLGHAIEAGTEHERMVVEEYAKSEDRGLRVMGLEANTLKILASGL